MNMNENTPDTGNGGALPLLIYTDGSCLGNPGPGGWAAVIVRQLANGEEVELIRLIGHDPSTTNNRMELVATIAALSSPDLPSAAPLIIRTDSEYLRKGATEWMAGWKARGWKTSDRKPAKNRDLWEVIDRLTQSRLIHWEHVRAHSGDQWNEEADGLARDMSKRAGNV